MTCFVHVHACCHSVDVANKDFRVGRGIILFDKEQTQHTTSLRQAIRDLIASSPESPHLPGNKSIPPTSTIENSCGMTDRLNLCLLVEGGGDSPGYRCQVSAK